MKTFTPDSSIASDVIPSPNFGERNNGRIAGPDAQLLALGNQACAASQQGVSAAQTVNAIYSSTQLRSPADAQFI